MSLRTLASRRGLDMDIGAVGRLIAGVQRGDGEIPWFDGDKTDPWDHVEAAMGLNVAGRSVEARAAFEWLAAKQLDGGSWYASYRDGAPDDRTLDANMTSYVAVGVYHDFLLTGDVSFVRRMWPVVAKALAFAVGLQAPGGEIYWAISPEGRIDRMALLTGSSSVYMSLKCGLALARELGIERPDWFESLVRLGGALRDRPHAFNMTKSRFSMDWFYPVLAGALTGAEARRRIEKGWERFVVDGQGVLCVSDQPWVTMAETSELVLALAAMGNRDQARIVFNWIKDRTYEDGSYWCGFTHPDTTIWPEDRITWTNAVVLLAADALYGLTPAARIFDHGFWREKGLEG